MAQVVLEGVTKVYPGGVVAVKNLYLLPRRTVSIKPYLSLESGAGEK